MSRMTGSLLLFFRRLKVALAYPPRAFKAHKQRYGQQRSKQSAAAAVLYAVFGEPSAARPNKATAGPASLA